MEDDIALAMITAPRKQSTVAHTIESLRAGGFRGLLHLFAEPAARVPAAPGVRVRWNDRTLGMWRNWRGAATTVLRERNAPFVLLLEDDVRFSARAAATLRQAIARLPLESWGLASLFTPQHNASGGVTGAGWKTLAPRRHAWGSLAYCFSRASLSALLHEPSVLLHRHHKGTDEVVSAAMHRLGREIYLHLPSLCEHAGDGISTVGHRPVPTSVAVGFDA